MWVENGSMCNVLFQTDPKSCKANADEDSTVVMKFLFLATTQVPHRNVYNEPRMHQCTSVKAPADYVSSVATESLTAAALGC